MSVVIPSAIMRLSNQRHKADLTKRDVDLLTFCVVPSTASPEDMPSFMRKSTQIVCDMMANPLAMAQAVHSHAYAATVFLRLMHDAYKSLSAVSYAAVREEISQQAEMGEAFAWALARAVGRPSVPAQIATAFVLYHAELKNGGRLRELSADERAFLTDGYRKAAS